MFSNYLLLKGFIADATEFLSGMPAIPDSKGRRPENAGLQVAPYGKIRSAVVSCCECGRAVGKELLWFSMSPLREL
jgi:hypothetical protein